MMKIAKSTRLSYRLLTSQDGELLYQLNNDAKVMRYLNGGKVSSRQDIDAIDIPRMESYRNSEQGWGLWGVFIADSNEFIGWILIRPMEFFTDNPELDNLEIGWRFIRSSWGKGYATEAAKHIKDQLIQKSDIKAFSAIADEENLASIAIMKKLGMEYMKTYSHHDPLSSTEAVYYQIKT